MIPVTDFQSKFVGGC